MKNFFALGTLTILFVLVLTGCSTISYERSEIQSTVIECEKGTFHPNSYYQTKANTCLAEKNIVFWQMYNDLAEEHGSYDYNVTVNIDGTNYVVIRFEEYEIGEQIVIEKVDTYKDSQLEKTEYK